MYTHHNSRITLLLSKGYHHTTACHYLILHRVRQSIGKGADQRQRHYDIYKLLHDKAINPFRTSNREE